VSCRDRNQESDHGAAFSRQLSRRAPLARRQTAAGRVQENRAVQEVYVRTLNLSGAGGPIQAKNQSAIGKQPETGGLETGANDAMEKDQGGMRARLGEAAGEW